MHENELDWEMPEESAAGDDFRPPSRRRKVLAFVVIGAMILAALGLLAANIWPSSQPEPSPAAVAMQVLKGHGLTTEQAAGIVGNLQYESGLNPAAVQKNGPGHGIAMWQESGPAWQDVLNRAKQTGTPSTDLRLQLDVLWQDLSVRHPEVLTKLRRVTYVEVATSVFIDFYLHPARAEQSYKQRLALAKQALTTH